MVFRIKHTTHYRYSSEVFLEPHLLRIRPRTDAYQTLKIFDLDIFPFPSAKNMKVGLNNYNDYMLWFEGHTTELKIIATSVVEMENANPFNFIIYPFTATQLPMRYNDVTHTEVMPFLTPVSKDEKVQKLAKELMLDIDFQTLPFLSHLTRYLYEHFQVEKPNPFSPPVKPEVTLEKTSGSYKDLAYLQLALCREAGIASRYVLGYHVDSFIFPNSLHAWVEVYLPGAGWKGFDATTGMAISERHIALTAAHAPSLCNLVTGTYRGNASSHLDTSIEITQISS